jgi:hypothetical protein
MSSSMWPSQRYILILHRQCLFFSEIKFMEYGLTKMWKASSHQRNARVFHEKISDLQGVIR